MPSINTDSALWYNVGEFGEAGYAVPNWSNDVASQNETIINVVNTMGENLFAIMHSPDVDLRTPPSINTIRKVHKLIVRARQILAGRAIPASQMNMEAVHATPVAEVFKVYPVPYFKVRNSHLKSYCFYTLTALTEMMQHTENRKAFDISTDFAGLVGQYLTRIYTRMATELFGIAKEVAEVPGYLMTEEILGSYNPSQFFTSTELVDTVAPYTQVFTEDRIELLRSGIKVTDLPNLTPYPSIIDPSGTGGVPSGGTPAESSTVPAFPPVAP